MNCIRVATLRFLTLYCNLRSYSSELIANGIILALTLLTIAIFFIDRYNRPLMMDD
jgi:hypothetical protein